MAQICQTYTVNVFCKYVLINYIAEKERSHDADVTGRVSATWTHFSSFGNATDGVSLGKTVCRLLVESVTEIVLQQI